MMTGCLQEAGHTRGGGELEASFATRDYSATEVMVRGDLDLLARQFHTHVSQPVGPAGVGGLAVPEALELDEFLSALRDGGAEAWPMGRITGSALGEHAGWQWHLDNIEVESDYYSLATPTLQTWALRDVTVAVVDSGVAPVDGLDSSDWVLAVDLVDDDDDPDDAHGHGTHIASIIAGWGQTLGVAPGTSLAVVRVLDETNSGVESDLINGIQAAVDSGADVVNLSLSFGPGYVPSSALLATLDDAAAAGVLIVGAAGNDGLRGPSWPAASPSVIAVAGLDSKDHLTAYTNYGAAIEISAPGGDDNDHDGDGYADGILAQTWLPGGSPGSYFWSGSSQAAAQVSGLLARLLAEGVDPGQARVALQQKADSLGGPEKGTGAGHIRVKDSTKLAWDKPEDIRPSYELHAAMLPYLMQDGDRIRPAAILSVVGGTGALVKDAELFIDYSGSSSGVMKCKTDDTGSCAAKGDKILDDGPIAWSLSVGAVKYADVYHFVGTAIMMTDQLEVLTAAIDADSQVQDRLLAVTWDADKTDLLGDVAPGVSVWNTGSGLVTSPLGVALNWEALSGTVTKSSLDLDGSGLVTSPLGFISVRLIDLDGSGLVTSPLGFGDLRLIGIGGTGLVTSPLGFDPGDLIIPSRGTGLVTSPLGFKSDPILLHEGSWSSLTGTSVGTTLESGGFLTEDAVPLASQLVGAGYAGLSGATTDTASGASEGAAAPF